MANINAKMRSWHRNLGYFLTGIMAMYALSGITLIFRKVDTFKVEKVVEKTIEKGLDGASLANSIKKKDLQTNQVDNLITYEGGQYDKLTGKVTFTEMKNPYILDKMNHLHKATTNDPLFFLNIFFGLSLLFFVISAFWMYTPKMPVFKKGMVFAIVGFFLTLLLIFV